MNTRDKLLVNATVGDLADALVYSMGIAITHNEDCLDENPAKETKKHFVYGYAGLMQLLGCSRSTAGKIIQSGTIEPAITRTGKLLIIDRDLTLELLKMRSKATKTRNRR